MAYFGKSSSVWNVRGKSYSELSTSTFACGTGASQPSTAGINSSSNSDQNQPVHKAGAPSSARPRGAGTFVAQGTWSLGSEATSSLSSATESKMHYKPPPAGIKREGPCHFNSDFPHPHYPHEFKTVNQADFGADSVKGHVRARPVKGKETVGILPQDVAPQYTTAYGSTFDGGRTGSSEVKAGRRAGHPATQDTGYNIINGGRAFTNNAFERFEGGQDYRRHR